MKILILGSSGFIGRNLTRHLSIDHNVLSLDKFNVSQELNIDVESFSQVKKAISKSKPDVIINLAARTDLLGKQIEDYSVNWKGVENIIQAIEEIEIEPLLIHFSSMLVCKMGYTPQLMSEFKPDTIYGKSKVKSERILIDRKFNFPVFILRPTTVWGYDAEKPYSTFIKIVKSFGWLSLSVFDAKRDFCDIRVLVDLISKIISSKDRLHNSFMSSYYISDEER